MGATVDPVERLGAGVAQAEAVVARIGPEQYGWSTPCDGWTVRDLVHHMIGALVMFAAVARDGQADPALFERDLIGDDAAASLGAAGREAVALWSVPGRLDGMANLPFGEMPAAFALQLPSMDMLVHSWDLATATDMEVAWDESLVSDVWAFSRETFDDPAMRGDDFAPPVTVDDDADDLSRLVAFLGRRP